MRILFNTEGNKRIGMGAFYNCIALAEGFRKRLSPEIKFFISDDSEADVEGALLAEYDVSRIDMKDVSYFSDYEQRYKPDIIIQDLLSLTQDHVYLQKKSGAKVIDILHDSNFTVHKHADIVINLLYDSQGKGCLYGPRYAILDCRFQNLKKKIIKDIASEILISFGGADVNNLTIKIVKILDQISEDLSIKAVIGPAFRDIDLFEKEIRSLRNPSAIFVYQDVKNMHDLIVNSDLGIISGGRTICEFAAAGTPAITFAQNELEFNRLKEFETWNNLINFGYFNEGADNLHEDIHKIILDKDIREGVSRRGQETVDGKGVDRIIDNIMGSML